MQALTRVEQQKLREEEAKKEQSRQRASTKVQNLYGDIKDDMLRCLLEFRNGLELLVPDFTQDTNEVEETGSKSISLDLQVSGKFFQISTLLFFCCFIFHVHKYLTF